MAKSGNINLSPGEGTKPDYEEYNIKKSHDMTTKLAYELCNETSGMLTRCGLVTPYGNIDLG